MVKENTKLNNPKFSNPTVLIKYGIVRSGKITFKACKIAKAKKLVNNFLASAFFTSFNILYFKPEVDFTMIECEVYNA